MANQSLPFSGLGGWFRSVAIGLKLTEVNEDACRLGDCCHLPVVGVGGGKYGEMGRAEKMARK